MATSFSSVPAATPAPHAAVPPTPAVEPTPAATLMAPPSTAPPAPNKPAAAAAGTPGMHTPGSAVRPTLGDLQSILSGMGLPPPSADAAGGGLTAQQAAAALAQVMMSAGRPVQGEGPLLSDVLTSDVLLSALTSEAVQQRLAPYLPEEHRNASALRELVTSPQFSSQLSSFSRALASGQIDLAQFGLPPGAAFSVADFLLAIQNSAPQAQQGEGGEGGGDVHMDEGGAQ